MAELGHASDPQALVQSMLQKLRLQEQRSDQARISSEDASSQDALGKGGCVAGEPLTGSVDDSLQTLRSRWAAFRKGSTKSLELSKGNTGQKESLTFSDIEDVPKWDRKQLRFSVVADRISERKNGLVDEPLGHLHPPMNSQSYMSSPGETTNSPEFPGGPLTPLSPGCVAQVMTGSEQARRDSATTDDNLSVADSLSRDGGTVDVQVAPDNVRKNKRKWAETKTKRFTQKIKDKWRDRHSSVEKQNEIEEKIEEKHRPHEQVASTASCGVQDDCLLPSPIGEAQDEVTLSAQGYDSLSLYAFDLGFETSLMEDIFTGPEWTKILALSDSHSQVISKDTDDRSSTYLAEAKQCETIQTPTRAPEVFDCEATLTVSASAAAMEQQNSGVSDVDQAVCSQDHEEGVNQLTSSVEVSEKQLWIEEMTPVDQNTDTKPNSNNEFQSTTENLQQAHMQGICHNQSETALESETGDVKDEEQTEADLSQTNTNNVTPYQTEIAEPTPDEIPEGGINPYEEVAPDTLHQDGTTDMLNPYLEIDMGDDATMSETEDASPMPSSHTGDGRNLNPGEGQENSPQLLPLTDFSYVKAEEGDNSSAHEKRRRVLQLEERETFIDEEDDEENVPCESLSWRKVPLSPPPFPPPLPPQRSISVDSDSSSSYLEIVPKKRRLDSGPRRVRFAEKVVMLPTYIQPEVEDWPEKEGGEEIEEEEEDEEEEMEDSDMDDKEDVEEMGPPQEMMSPAEEVTEGPREAQSSLYSWILGITKKTKRKGPSVNTDSAF